MKSVLALLLAIPLFAQAPSAPPEPATKPADQTAAASAAASPAPATEPWLTGSVDLGYQWLTDVGGSFQSYRSLIDLRQGPKLFGLDFTIQDPGKRLFDRLQANAYGWGDEPYNTAHVSAQKTGIYDFTFDYRNIAYFNALPSFANPLAPGGLDEQTFDTRRRMTSVDLELFPGRHIIPYLAFDRNTGHGNGIDTWVTDATNEYAVPSLLRDSTNNYRGGLRFEYNRFHVTLEQGGTTFKNDDQLYENQATGGDWTTPFLGQALSLNNLRQLYGIRGDSIYSRALLTASPASWIDFSGQFLYSEPRTGVHYTDLAGGNLVLLSSLLFYSGQTDLAVGTARQPHVSGNAGFEMRPLRRVRIIESWMTDRYHDASFGLFSSVFFTKPAAASQASSLANLQVVNYNQNQVDVLFDLTPKITLRGGYRRIWGDASVLAGQLSQSGNFVSGSLGRNVGIAGLSLRPFQKFSANLDYEGGMSDQVYFRTSLNDYNRARVRARYQATGSLSLQANFLVLNNQNPAQGVKYDFQSRANSLAFYWTPNGGKRITVMGEYDRSTVRSNILYLNLPFLTSAASIYRENSHTATSTVDLALPAIAGRASKLTAGGSLFISSGSRPSRLYEPLARLSVPLRPHLSWNTQWTYYGWGEQFYLFEGFRVHVFQTGLRLSR